MIRNPPLWLLIVAMAASVGLLVAIVFNLI